MEGTHGRRRLTTILAADVVGYSRLMAEDEEATLRTLAAHREVIDRLIARHDGRIFNTGGDSVLAEFGSAVEAVRCAIAVQDDLRARNAELVPARRLHLRIGVNVGDVLAQESGDLLGDGVNVAARLEGLAEPGGICISGSTFEQVKNKLSIGFQDLGPQQVRNIPEPVAAFSITAAPVSVSSRRAAGWRLPVAAAFVVALAGVTALWLYGDRAPGPKPLSAFPENVTTDALMAGDIADLMTGVTISGRRAADDLPFKIVLNPDKSASYTYGAGGESLSETGRWWVEDHRFCLQVPRFAMGERACPRIVKSGQALTAVRPVNGRILPWSLKK